jgi:NAD(P)-dependent dehydrogenase (short-subunit alcohol dehydrogenase family)
MDSLAGKVAIITGAASGIGRATALALSSRGARIVVADINGDGADLAAAAINVEGGQAEGVRCDVNADNAFGELKTFALDRFGRIDVVMNNVGGLTRGRPEYLPEHEWRRVLDLNLMSVVRSNAAFLPLMIEQRHGHIVNTASFAGLFSYSYDRLPYATAKAAVVQMSEGLRLYLRPMGIGVTVVCPGPVATNIIASLPPTFGPELPVRGPGEQFDILMPATVGEQVAAAIVNDTFMLYTHAQVRDILVERASDWNSFIDRQSDKLAEQA